MPAIDHGSRPCPSFVDLAIPVPTAADISHAEVRLLRAHQIQHYRQEREYLLKEQTRPTRQHLKSRPQLVRQLNLKLSPDGLLVAPDRLVVCLIMIQSLVPFSCKSCD